MAEVRDKTTDSVFQVIIWYYRGELIYPCELIDETLGLFSSLEKAENAIRDLPVESKYQRYYDTDMEYPEEANHISHFVIEEHAQDINAYYTETLTIRYYDEHGRYTGGRTVPENTPLTGIRSKKYSTASLRNSLPGLMHISDRRII